MSLPQRQVCFISTISATAFYAICNDATLWLYSAGTWTEITNVTQP